MPNVSQRTGTKLLTRDDQIIVQKQFQLRPIEASSGQAGTRRRVPWDDAGNRELQDKFAEALMVKLRDAVQLRYEGLKWKYQANALPMDSLRGAGDAAKKVVDKAFGDWVKQAVLTPADLAKQKKFTFTTSGPDPTLIDSTNSTARAKAGQRVSPSDLAAFLAFSDKWVRQLMADHHFETGPAATEEEKTFLRERIIPRFHRSGHAVAFRVRPARLRQHEAWSV